MLEIKILKNNVPMDASWAILSVDVLREVNKIPWARITIKDGSAEDSEYDNSSHAFFKLGETIEIQVKEEGNFISLFQGLVVRHIIKADINNSVLIVELKDKAFKLTRERRSAVYGDKDTSKSDKTIIGTDIKNRWLPQTFDTAGMEDGPKYKGLVQYYCTDWDFILSRTEANGYWVVLEDDKISIKKPTIDEDGIIADHRKFAYKGTTIYSFHMELDGRHHYKDVESKKLNIGDDQLSPPPPQPQPQQAPQDLGFSPLFQANNQAPPSKEMIESASNLGGEKYPLVYPADMSADGANEHEQWKTAMELKTRLSLFRGRIRVEALKHFKDNIKIKLGDTIEIEKIAGRFNGRTLVSGIRHQITMDGWFADIRFGMSPEWFTQQNKDIVAPPASGLAPAINGLHIGVVVASASSDVDKPDGHFKVKVKIPGMDTDPNIVWARMASPYAGNGMGFYFRPEVGDEVVLGFLNDDPRHAIILGSLHNSGRKPPFIDAQNDDVDNHIKGIKTRGGLSIEFHDEFVENGEEKRRLEIKTPNNNSLILSDEHKKIEIKDHNDNQILMNDSGITLTVTGEDAHNNNRKVTISGPEVIITDTTNDNRITINDAGIILKARGNDNITLTGVQVGVQGTTVNVNGDRVNVNGMRITR